jgi:hypothetical protein
VSRDHEFRQPLDCVRRTPDFPRMTLSGEWKLRGNDLDERLAVSNAEPSVFQLSSQRNMWKAGR